MAFLTKLPGLHRKTITARDPGTLEHFSLDYPGQVLPLSLDLNDRDSMEQAVREAKSRFGTIDVRVNNAGCGYLAAVEESDPKEVEALFQTNFFGPAQLMQLVFPQMREKRSGMIVNVTSIGAVRGALGNGYYSAAKGALELLTEAMAKETEHLGIRAMLVEPGAFRTGFYGERLKGSSPRIADYDVLADRYRKDRMTNAGNQPGDPDRGGEIIVETVLKDHPPFRLLLGKGAAEAAEKELEGRLAEIRAWRSVSEQADFPEE